MLYIITMFNLFENFARIRILQVNSCWGFIHMCGLQDAGYINWKDPKIYIDPICSDKHTEVNNLLNFLIESQDLRPQILSAK